MIRNCAFDRLATAADEAQVSIQPIFKPGLTARPSSLDFHEGNVNAKIKERWGGALLMMKSTDAARYAHVAMSLCGG